MRKPERNELSLHTSNSIIRHPELVSGSDVFQCLQGFYLVSINDTW